MPCAPRVRAGSSRLLRGARHRGVTAVQRPRHTPARRYAASLAAFRSRMTTLYEHALSSLSRRRFLDAARMLGGAAALTALPCARALGRPLFRAYPFSLGVASGDPSPDGVVLWTRLAPEPLAGGGMPMAAVEVGWEVASDEGMRTVVRRGTELARPELGHSVHAEVGGLGPGREYWYRFTVGGERSQVGRTRTAPAPGAPTTRLRFATCGCSNYESGHFTAYRHLANERFDFVFHSGDYLYEGRADGGRHAKVRQHVGDELYTLEDYRDRYALYKSDPRPHGRPRLRAVHRHVGRSRGARQLGRRLGQPRHPAGAVPAAPGRRVPGLLRGDAAAADLGPRRRGLRLHRDFAFGDLVALNALDTRQYRSRQACGRTGAARCEVEFADAARTMLGAEQEAWLDARLGASRARWNVVAQQVPIFGIGATGAPSRNPHLMDQWPGYPGAGSACSTRSPGDGSTTSCSCPATSTCTGARTCRAGSRSPTGTPWRWSSRTPRSRPAGTVGGRAVVAGGARRQPASELPRRPARLRRLRRRPRPVAHRLHGRGHRGATRREPLARRHGRRGARRARRARELTRGPRRASGTSVSRAVKRCRARASGPA